MNSPITPERQAKRDLYPSVGFRGRQPVDASTVVLEPFSIAVAVASEQNPAAVQFQSAGDLIPANGQDGRLSAYSPRLLAFRPRTLRGTRRAVLNSCRRLAGSSFRFARADKAYQDEKARHDDSTPLVRLVHSLARHGRSAAGEETETEGEG